MGDSPVRIRVATTQDAPALHAIYAPYVENTALTLEHVAPTVAEFAQRITDTLKSYPYLVAEVGGAPVGYAYASRFRTRRAYDWSVETSIYVDREVRGAGVGGSLYRALEQVLREQGVCNMCACAVYPHEPDEYANQNSACFHEHLGFRRVGEFENSGHKFGRWYNLLWMEKSLAEHGAQPSPFRPFGEVRHAVCDKFGIE